MSSRTLVIGLLTGFALLLPGAAAAGERDWRGHDRHRGSGHHQFHAPRHIVVPPHHDRHGSWRHTRSWHDHQRPHHKHWRPHGGKVWYYRPGHGPHRSQVHHHHHHPRPPFVIVVKPWW
jgi:hypothetical protein